MAAFWRNRHDAASLSECSSMRRPLARSMILRASSRSARSAFSCSSETICSKRPSAISIAGMMSLFWNGFTRYASAPASRAWSTRSCCENAVRMSTAASRSPAIVRAAVRPSMPGILMSRIARSGLSSRTSSDGVVAAAGFADDLVVLFFEDLLEVEANDRLVFGEDRRERVSSPRRTLHRTSRRSSTAPRPCGRAGRFARSRARRPRAGACLAGGSAHRRAAACRGPRRRRPASPRRASAAGHPRLRPRNGRTAPR